MNNPYIEKYMDEAIVSIVDEIFNAIDDREKRNEEELISRRLQCGE